MPARPAVRPLVCFAPIIVLTSRRPVGHGACRRTPGKPGEQQVSTDSQTHETGSSAARSRPKTSLRDALVSLYAALFLPLVFLGTALLVHQWQQQRELAKSTLAEEAASLGVAVEREVALDLAVLNTLTALPDFDRRDWAALHATATLAARSRPGSWIVVTEPGGQYLLNTVMPFGTPLPNMRLATGWPAEVEWKGRKLPFPSWNNFAVPLETGKPYFSNLMYGPVAKAPVVAITVPAFRPDGSRYVMSLAYTPEAYVKLLMAQSAQDGLLRAIVDQQGLVIARSSGAEDFVGRRGNPPFDKDLDRLPREGGGEVTSLDGRPVFFAYRRVDVNGWTVAVATPRDVVLAPARRVMWAWAAVLLLTGLIGLAVAVRLWRRVAMPLAELAAQVRSHEADRSELLPASIAEIEVLRQAMIDASHEQQVRREAERARELAERRFRLVVEASPTGILMVDDQGVITLVNRRVEDLFGYARDELLGQGVGLLVPQSRRDGHGVHLAGYFRTATARAMGAGRDLHGRRKDGSEMPIEIGLVPIETGEGRFALASIVDISERKRAEDELRRSNHDLEQFAYIASHDLQEPLRMVANYTGLLGDRYRGRLDDKADRYIHYAVDGAKRMQALITDLLSFSRVGARAAVLLPVDASKVMAQLLDMLRRSDPEHAACIEVGPLPWVLAEEAQLKQVFQNLITNAIKFRSERPLRIVVTATRDDGMWRLTVADNGIGFDPRYAERIFQMFQRLHDRGHYDGSGIGLAIVQRIVERHGGQVWAESTPGEGSRIGFSIRAT